MKSFLLSLCAGLALSLSFTSCKKEKEDPKPVTPPIAAPTITSLSPTSGQVGAVVTITGTNLTGATVVKFNGTTAPTFTVGSATAVTVTVPVGATTGPVTVVTPGGTSGGVTFTVTLTKTQLITNKNWKMTAATVDPGYPSGGTLHTNLYPLIDDCYKDNLSRFELPNVFKYDEGATRCTTTDPQTLTGTWTFNFDETKFTTNYIASGVTYNTTYDILELTDTTLKVSYLDNLGSATNFTITETYTKQ